VVGVFPSTSHVAVVAQCVTDAAIAYAVISGHDAEDAATLNQPRITLNYFGPGSTLESLRIGVWHEWSAHASAPVATAMAMGIDAVTKRGAFMHRIAIDALDVSLMSHILAISSDLAMFRKENPEVVQLTQRSGSHGLRLHCALSDLLGDAESELAVRLRTRSILIIKQLFHHCDVILCPTTPNVSPKIPEADNLDDFMSAIRFCFISNLAGFPAVCVPVAQCEKTQMPMSLMVMARPWHENMALRVVRVIEAVNVRSRPVVHVKQLPPEY